MGMMLASMDVWIWTDGKTWAGRSLAPTLGELGKRWNESTDFRNESNIEGHSPLASS